MKTPNYDAISAESTQTSVIFVSWAKWMALLHLENLETSAGLNINIAALTYKLWACKFFL